MISTPPVARPAAAAPQARAALAAAAALAACAPIALAFSYVYRNAVDVPFYDQWRFIPLIEKWLGGTMTWSDLVAQHDGHRIVTARLVTLASARFAHWNILVEVWAGFAFLAATAALVTWLHWRSLPGRTPAARLASAVPSLLVVASLHQWENLLAPWALGAFGANFLVVLTFVLVDRDPRPRWVAAFATAVIASVTFTNALLVWPIVAGQLGLRAWARAPIPSAAARAAARTIGLWVAGAVGFGAVYFVGYTAPPREAMAGAGHVAARFLAALGGTLSLDPAVIASGAAGVVVVPVATGIAIATGALLLVLCAALALTAVSSRRELDAVDRIAIAMGTFGVGSAAMLALGRSNLDVVQALSSRYATPLAPAIVGCLLLLARIAARAAWARTARPAVITLVVASSLVALGTELHVGPARRAFYREWARRVRAYRTATDAELANPHYPPGQIRAWSEVLERLDLSTFHHPPAALKPRTTW